jgi:hypothetical protein
MEGTWQNRGNLKDPNQFFVDEKGGFLQSGRHSY